MSEARGHVDSWYARSAMPAPDRPALAGRHTADVAVLGGGLCGLSAALNLAEAGHSVVLLEAQRIGWGASGRSGGQVIFGYGCDQAKIAGLLGQEASKALFEWSVEAVDEVKRRIRRHAIPAHWREGHAHVAIKPRHVRELKAWQDDLATHYGYDLQWWEREPLQAVVASPRYIGALYDPNSGHLHPLNYTLGLAAAAEQAGARLFEDSAVVSLARGAKPVLRTAQGEVQADYVVLAGNALSRGIAPELEARIMPVGTYIGATAPMGRERARELVRNDMAVADINWALDYFRLSHDHRLLFGGRASYSTLPPPNLRGVMVRRMRAVFPQLADVELEYVWGGYIDITRNRAPHWGRLTPNIYFAQGFCGHGVASTGLAGDVIAEAIAGQAQRLDVFERIAHQRFPGGTALRRPLLVAAMSWYKLRDLLW